MEAINISQFLDYLSTWYPFMVPVAILVTIIMACGLDWVRVFVIGYVDDFETKHEKKVWPFLRKFVVPGGGFPEQYIKYADYSDDRCVEGGEHAALWVRFDKYWRYLKFKDEATAKQVRGLVDRFGKERTYEWINHGIDMQGAWAFPLLLLYLLVLSGILLAYKLMPVITTSVGIAYFILRVARSTVRIGKKLAAHIKDPNAHGKGENQNE